MRFCLDDKCRLCICLNLTIAWEPGVSLQTAHSTCCGLISFRHSRVSRSWCSAASTSHSRATRYRRSLEVFRVHSDAILLLPCLSSRIYLHLIFQQIVNTAHKGREKKSREMHVIFFFYKRSNNNMFFMKRSTKQDSTI